MANCENCWKSDICKNYEPKSTRACSEYVDKNDMLFYYGGQSIDAVRSVRKPLLDRISNWDDGSELIYKCSNCGVSFGFYGDEENFCHNCGIKIDWDNVPRHCSEKISSLYHNADCEKKKAIINKYNRLILENAINGDKGE